MDVGALSCLLRMNIGARNSIGGRYDLPVVTYEMYLVFQPGEVKIKAEICELPTMEQVGK